MSTICPFLCGPVACPPKQKLAEQRIEVRDEFREMKAAYLLFGPFYCAYCVLSHLILMFKCMSIPYLD